MSKNYAIAMQKGGVGKTTSAINLAAGFAFADYRTLLVDLDPQGNTTSGLTALFEEVSGGAYELLTGAIPAEEAIIETSLNNLSLLPSGPDLNSLRADMARSNSDFTELKQGLEEIRAEYDRIIIDCPPSLGPLTLNAFAAVNEVLIPLQAEYYALEGLSQLYSTIERVRERLNPRLKLFAILLTMYDRRTNLARDVREEVEKFFSGQVLKTSIPRNVKISEAPGYGKPVILHAPLSRGSKSYLRATEEVIYRE